MHNNSTLKLTDDQRDAFKKEYPSEIFPEYYIIKVNNFNDVAKSTLDEWIYLFKHSAIKSEFTAKGILKASEILDIMKMSKAEREIYDRYIDNRRIALDQLQTAIRKERRKQEAKIKQLEDKHSKELQEKDNQLQEKDNQLQENKNKLQQLAQMLLANGVSKEQIFEQTGIKL